MSFGLSCDRRGVVEGEASREAWGDGVVVASGVFVVLIVSDMSSARPGEKESRESPMMLSRSLMVSVNCRGSSRLGLRVAL